MLAEGRKRALEEKRGKDLELWWIIRNFATIIGKREYMDTFRIALIVDDNTSIAEPLQPCLNGMFDRVLIHTIPNCVQDVLNATEVDVILFNMNCLKSGSEQSACHEEGQADSLQPDNGQDVLKWIRKVHRKYPESPIVLLTSPEDVKLAEKGVSSGAFDFVTMPWGNDELVRVLQRAIGVNACPHELG